MTADAMVILVVKNYCYLIWYVLIAATILWVAQLFHMGGRPMKCFDHDACNLVCNAYSSRRIILRPCLDFEIIFLNSNIHLLLY